MKKSALYLTTAAATAALYVLLTWLGNAVGIPAIGPVEFRFSEGLTILPVFTSAAIPGLTVGCLVANLILGGSVWDIIFGSLATLIGWLLGGPVGVGTLICAFGAGPIMQFAFHTVRFDAKTIRHQHFLESVRVFFPDGKAKPGSGA